MTNEIRNDPISLLIYSGTHVFLALTTSYRNKKLTHESPHPHQIYCFNDNGLCLRPGRRLQPCCGRNG